MKWSRLGAVVSARTVALLLLIGVTAAFGLTHDPRQGEGGIYDDVIFDREVLEYQVHGSGPTAMVDYNFLGESIIGKLDPKEDVSKRTNSSYTKRIGTTDDGRGIYELIAYAPNMAFAKKDGKWFVREFGRTSYAVFNRARARNPVASFFWKEVYADTASPFSGSGDGHVGYSNEVFTQCNAASWTNVRNATSGNNADYTNSTTISTEVVQDQFGDIEEGFTCNSTLDRAFYPIDTSSIPSGSTISAASLNLYVYSTVNGDDDGGDWITILQATTTTHTSLVNGDYSKSGTPEGNDTGERKDITGISTNAYLTITLNSTGRGWVKVSGDSSSCSATTGITCLATREGHDVLNSRPLAKNAVYVRPSEYTGTANDPYLSVTYTAPTTPPTVTTSAASSVTISTATLNGNVTATGGAAATTCGFAWGTQSSLVGGDTATTTDSTCPGSTGAFTKALSSLTPGTTYYFRAYATNSAGNGYGSITSFTTTAAPSVTTSAATAISPIGAVLNGSITGGGAATTCGFAWGTLSTLRGGDTATTSDSGCPSSVGAFDRTLTGLTQNTTYYFRAYGSNGVDGFGTIVSFTTSQTTPARVMRLFGNIRLGGVRLLGL